jgi:tripartite-type tricarboxylate transporter receptor subunit TctC
MLHLIGKTARAVLSVTLLASSTSSISAQDYPSRPVELVVPFPAGGGTEIVTRHVSDGLARRLGQPFVVLNRPGANTNLGTLAVVRSKPDGYTLLITSFGLAANPSLYRKLAFAPQTDLEPITLIANSPTVLTVPPSLPVNSLPELIAYARARPGELNYASYGVGSSPHLAAELFQSMTGTKMVHVPYGGGGPAAVGIMTNQAQALFSSVVTVLGMLAPAKTPAPIIDALHRASVSVLADASVRTRIAEQGAEVVASSPAEFRAFIKEETERLGRVIRDADIHLD